MKKIIGAALIACAVLVAIVALVPLQDAFAAESTAKTKTMKQEQFKRYTSLWTQAAEAKSEGKPQTRETILRQIIDSARVEGQWPEQLNAMKALVSTVSDYNWKGIEPSVNELEGMSKDFKTPVAKAVYDLMMVELILDWRYNLSFYQTMLDDHLHEILAVAPKLRKTSPEDVCFELVDYAGDILRYEWDSFVPAANMSELAMRHCIRVYENNGIRRDENMFPAFIKELKAATSGNVDNRIIARTLELDHDVENLRGDDIDKQSLNLYQGLVMEYPRQKATVIPQTRCVDLLQGMACQIKDKDEAEKRFLEIKDMCDGLLAQELPDDCRSTIETILHVNDNQDCDLDAACPVYPSEKVEYVLAHKNLSNFKVTLYRMNDDYEIGQSSIRPEEKYIAQFDEKAAKFAAKVDSFEIRGLKSRYGIQESDTLTVDIRKPGVYLLRFEPLDKQNKYSSTIYQKILRLAVSRIGVAKRDRCGDTELYPVDLISGQPLGKVKVASVTSDNDKEFYDVTRIQVKHTDRYSIEGFTPVKTYSVDRYSKMSVRVQDGEDFYSPIMGIRKTETRKMECNSRQGAQIYTDRRLYKPTDTIRFNVVTYKADHKEGRVLAGLKISVSLYAPGEDKAVSRLDLVTNEFGSASGEFTIPEGYMNGSYLIRTDAPYTSTYVHVEEYKRPAFKVEMKRIDQIFKFGDRINVEGDMISYAGYGVSGGKVHYKVWMNPARFYRWFWNFDPELVTEGDAVSDADGHFVLPFTAIEPKIDQKTGRGASYTVEIDCTDPQGETRSASVYVNVGDIPLLLSTNVSSSQRFDDVPLIDKTKADTLTIDVTNLAYVHQEISGTYTLSKEGKEVKKGTFDSGKATGLKWSSLPSGRYTLHYGVVYNGMTIDQSDDMIVFSPEDKHIPANGELFYYTLRDDNVIDFLVGTSEKDLWLECELFEDDKCQWHKSIHLCDEMMRITLPYLDKYEDEISLSLFAIRNAKQYSKTHDFNRVRDHSLPLTIDSFRDKTTPGTAEKFTVKTSPDVEAMVSIFDVTTDRLGSNYFGFSPFGWISSSAPSISVNMRDHSGGFSFERENYGGRLRGRLVSSMAVNRAVAGDAMVVDEAMPMLESKAVATSNAAMYDSVKEMDEEVAAAGPQEQPQEEEPLRSNFDETVAFLPQITSDADGNINVEYTTTGALSTFRVLMLLHDKKLSHAGADRQFIVQKDLMVSPNLPQFLREGDRVVLKSKVVNLTSDPVEGKAKISFFDAETGEDVTIIGAKEIPVALAGGAQSEVSWEITAPSGVALLGVKIVYSTPIGSDGEQNVIPVIPSREQMTEALSVIMDGKGSFEIDVTDLLNRSKAADGKLIFEVSSPITSAFESLPTAAKVRSSCLTSYISALYVNQVGSYLVKTYPQIRNAAETMIKEGPAEPRISVNSEITDILMTETPWAYKRQEDLDRVSYMKNIVDETKAESLRQYYYRQIKKLQRHDGGFVWFAGMDSSPYLTMLVLEKYNQMQQIGAISLTSSEKKMLEDAARYLDEEIRKEYEDYKEYCERNKKPLERDRLFYDGLMMLKIRSMYLSTPVAKSTEEALDFYMTTTIDNWVNGSIAQKASAATMLANFEDAGYGKKYKCEASAHKICESLVEYAVSNVNIGCYFPNAVMPYRGLMSTELYAHSELLRLFDKLSARYTQGSAADKKLADRMAGIVKGVGQWLMVQKHNQSWENDIATTDAISALMSSGVAGDSEPVFKVSYPKFALKQVARDGLWRQEVSLEDYLAVAGNDRRVVFENENNGLLMAAVYYKYTQPAQLAKASSNQLSVERTYWRVKGKNIEKLRDGDKLHIGDEIVIKYTLNNTENRSFVHLQGSRAALLQPQSEASGYRWGHYLENKTSVTNWFFYLLPEGRTELEERFFVSQEGTFSASLARVQSLYAPEYRGQSAGKELVSVK